MNMSSVQSPSGAHMVVSGRSILNFGGSSYLGLSSEPSLAEAASQAAHKWGSTSQLPRHYGFELEANAEVEQAAREFFGVDGAMYFATGYLFGQLALAGLADDYDVAVLDERAHYSLVDGAAVARKPVLRFRHCDAGDLERVVGAVIGEGKRPLVATDGMFPTYGVVAPLRHYWDVLEPHGAWLIVDESHAFGSLGEQGGGAVELEGVRHSRVMAGGSMGKAFCAHGGLAVGDGDAVARLWRAPAARGAVAGSSMGAAMSAAALRYVRGHPHVLDRLRANARILKQLLKRLALPYVESPSPVATFELSGAVAMQRLQEQLWTKDIFIIYSTYVGAGPNGALRLAAFADHDPKDFDRLERELAAALGAGAHHA